MQGRKRTLYIRLQFSNFWAKSICRKCKFIQYYDKYAITFVYVYLSGKCDPCTQADTAGA